ncbi:hypothetical protein KA057_00485 [Candidatus Gracilibacteria bacterium]|nr:hypothetical protein [Candidatus Gracilibacteria bacterium]
MNQALVAFVRSGMPLPPEKTGNGSKVLKGLGILGTAAIVVSLLTQTSEERIQIGQKLLVDPLTRLAQKIDLDYREGMNKDYPDYMPINHQPQDQ